jgi:hypothetical protein
MHDTIVAPLDHAPVTGLRFRADRFDEAMKRLGHTTEVSRARAAGITKMTLNRWRYPRRPMLHTPVRAHQVAAAIGLTVDQLFERVTLNAA